jgi:hypothetical protein
MKFTQLDMVTVFPPPGTTPSVRVGWVQGDINGTITINSTLTSPTPPAFTASGTAVIVNTNGDQLFLNAAFTGTFVVPPGSAPNAVAGGFTGTYTVTGGSGALAKQAPAGTVFSGTGVAVEPQVAPPGAATPGGFGPGAAFSQFTSSQKAH